MKKELYVMCVAGIIGFGMLASCSSLPSELQAGVDAGNAEALYKAGVYFSNLEKRSKALPLFLAAAEKGHADAQNYCGRYFDEGWGTEENNVKAVYWYSKAAEQNHVTAISNLAYMYDWGEGVSKNKQQAIALFKKALQLDPKHENASNGLFSAINNGYAPENLKGKTLVFDYSEAYYYDNNGYRHPSNEKTVRIKFTKPNKYYYSAPYGDGWEESSYEKIDRNTAIISYFLGSDGFVTYYTARFDKPNQGRMNFMHCDDDSYPTYNIKFRIE